MAKWNGKQLLGKAFLPPKPPTQVEKGIALQEMFSSKTSMAANIAQFLDNMGFKSEGNMAWDLHDKLLVIQKDVEAKVGQLLLNS